MNDELKKMERMLEKATAPGDAPAGDLDPETASLRETWLAFGQMLDSADSMLETTAPLSISPLPPVDGQRTNSVLLKEEKQGVGAKPAWRRWAYPLAAGLLAASLLVAAVMMWMHLATCLQDNPSGNEPPQVAAVPRPTTPSVRVPAKGDGKDEPKWDDALDEQIAQISWQMLCAQHNEPYRTDGFGLMQYRMEQMRQAMEEDPL
jgi:hypothetical protein